MCVLEEHRGRHHQNADVHEHGAVERHHRIDQVVAAGRALGAFVVPDVPRLHQRRMQIHIVRHHGRAQNGDGQIKASVPSSRGTSPVASSANAGLAQITSTQKQPAMIGDERQYESLERADAETLEPQQQQRIERRSAARRRAAECGRAG